MCKKIAYLFIFLVLFLGSSSAFLAVAGQEIPSNEAIENSSDGESDLISALVKMYTGIIEDASLSWEEKAISYGNRGLLYYNRGELEKALSDFNEALDRDPSVYWLALHRGYTEFDLGNYRAAISDFTSSLEWVFELEPDGEIASAAVLKSEQAHIYYLRGYAYHRTSRENAALLDLTTAIKLSPEFIEAHQQRSEVYTSMERLDAARSDLDMALKLDSENATTHYMSGYNYFLQNYFQDAIEEFSRTLELYPEMVDAMIDRAASYMSLFEFDQAESDYLRAIEVEPEFSLAHLGLSGTYYEQKRYVEALDSLEKGMDLSEKISSSLLYQRALLHRSAGQYKKSLSDLQEYKRVFRKARSEVGMAYHYHKGWTLLEMGDCSGAIKAFSQGILKQSGYTWAYFRRAQAYDCTGDRDAVILDFLVFVSLIKPEDLEREAFAKNFLARHRSSLGAAYESILEQMSR